MGTACCQGDSILRSPNRDKTTEQQLDALLGMQPYDFALHADSTSIEVPTYLPGAERRHHSQVAVYATV